MYKPSNGKALVLVKKPYVSHGINIEKASLYLSDNSTKTRVEATVNQTYPVEVGANRYKVAGLTNLIDSDTEGEYTVLELDIPACYQADLANSDWWAGEITLFYKRSVSEQLDVKATAKIVQDYAHTGKYSLLLPPYEPTTKVGHILEQKLLNLQDGKKYVFSAWVRVQKKQFPAVDKAVMSYDTYRSTIEVNGTTMGPAGPIIEGWQKIEGEFVYENRQITPNNDNNFEIIVKSLLNYVYLDDIRIFPADGNIVSYVYDPTDFKLQATLDDNNYATFYIYDEAGNLISTKRETERGIKSIQESRNYIQPTN